MFILKFKNAISPVVATALLLVVAVVAVVGFQGWFSTFSSGVFVDVEHGSQSSNSNVAVADIIGTNLYINAGNNLSVKSISVNNIDCNFNGSLSGMDEVNISLCLENVSGAANILVVTDDKVIESYQFIDSDVVVGDSELVIAPIVCTTNTAEGFSSGIGTLGDPWGICNCTQLQLMDNISLLANHFMLENNIDCSMTSSLDGGNGFNPIGITNSNKFTGTLKGNNYTIGDLFISRSGDQYVGLFTYLDTANFIQDLGLLNVNVSGNFRVGGIAGYLDNGFTLTNVFVTGSITGVGNQIGGLVGNFNDGIIEDSYADVIVVGADSIGGLAGSGGGSYVLDSLIDNSYSLGTITGDGDVGGLINYFNGFVDNSYSGANLVTTGRAGGLVGDGSPKINKSYAYGSISGPTSGGLIGHAFDSTVVLDSYWDTEKTGEASSVGATGGSPSLGGAVGQTTSELQTPTSNIGIYSNWSSSIWDFGTSGTYPILK